MICTKYDFQAVLLDFISKLNMSMYTSSMKTHKSKVQVFAMSISSQILTDF